MMADGPKGKSQREKFIEAARELGCDESEEDFAEIVRKVAHAPVAPADLLKSRKSKTKKVKRAED